MKRVLALLLAVATTLFVSLASAEPRITFELSHKSVAVGDLFQGNITILDDVEHSHGNPKLRLPDSIAIRGQMMGSQTQMTVVNGAMTRQVGINITFTLEAKKRGTFTVGPLSITWGGLPLTSKTLSITVGDARQPSANQNPWGRLRDLFDDDEPKVPAEEEFDPKLTLPAALGSHAFLHATLDKDTAVLGEQRTLSVYLYQDADLPSPEILSASEPELEGFLSKSLLPSGQEPPEVGKAKIGEHRYRVRLVRKQAIFPVQAGQLKVGPMRLKLRSRGNGDRASETFSIQVSEPPKAKRPGNYVLGTTGSYKADCTIEPRTSKDGIVGITMKLDGYGLFPDRLPMPATPQVTFEAPEIRENFVADEAGRWGGWRSFQYVAKIATKGTTDLGEVSLPFFNPSSKQYEAATCTLGKVVVENAAPPVEAVAMSPLLAELPPAEARLSGSGPSVAPLPKPLLWFAGVGPLALVGLGLVLAMPKRKERSVTPEQAFKTAIHAAEVATQAGRTKDAIGELERGIDTYVTLKYSLSLRADDERVARETLLERGVSTDSIDAILQFRASCTNSRYGTTAEVNVAPLLEGARALQRRLS